PLPRTRLQDCDGGRPAHQRPRRLVLRREPVRLLLRTRLELRGRQRSRGLAAGDPQWHQRLGPQAARPDARRQVRANAQRRDLAAAHRILALLKTSGLPGRRRAMDTPQDIFDVAIVGVGPTGLTLAHLLGRRGLRVLALEREPQFYGNARAVYTDDECMRVFQAAGVA